jgi:hypothetical protein
MVTWSGWTNQETVRIVKKNWIYSKKIERMVYIVRIAQLGSRLNYSMYMFKMEKIRSRQNT